MDTVTYPDSRVAEFIEHHFIPVRIKSKDKPDVAADYMVMWTPNVVIADDTGNVHYRIEGFLEPEEFLARLSLGMGKYFLIEKKYAEAAERFEEVAERHADSDAAAEALYWAGVAHYKESKDPAQLKPSWKKLKETHPDSEWARRTEIPKK